MRRAAHVRASIKEDTVMTARRAEQPHVPTLDRILGAIAQVVSKHRQTSDARAELQQCASENGKTSPAGKSPDAAALLDNMLAALGVDRTRRPFNEPALILDLQRLCTICDRKHLCVPAFTARGGGKHYREFCPSTYTLDYMMGRRH
jgi:hypothetical protein